MTGTILVGQAERIARLLQRARERIGATLSVLAITAALMASVAGARELERAVVLLAAGATAVYYVGRGWLRDPLEAHKGVVDTVVGIGFGLMALFPSTTCAAIDAAVLSVWAGLYWLFVEALDQLTGWLLNLPPRPV